MYTLHFFCVKKSYVTFHAKAGSTTRTVVEERRETWKRYFYIYTASFNSRALIAKRLTVSLILVANKVGMHSQCVCVSHERALQRDAFVDLKPYIRSANELGMLIFSNRANMRINRCTHLVTITRIARRYLFRPNSCIFFHFVWARRRQSWIIFLVQERWLLFSC